jgi:hypothetical protein
MRQVTKSVALAGAVALAATAGPAAAGPMVAFDTYIPVPADTANMQPGGVSLSESSSELDHVAGSGNLIRNDRLPEAADVLPDLGAQVEETA